MKKLLMISRYFAPQNTIGAVRPTKLAKYLQLENDFEITVLTCEDSFSLRDSLLEADSKHLSEIIRVSDGPLTKALERFFEKRNSKKNARAAVSGGAVVTKEHRSLVERLMANLNFIQEWLRCREYSRLLYKTIAPRLNEFDALWSTYSPISCHLAALLCKRRNPRLFWIADYRDQPYRKKLGMIAEKIQSAANARAVLKNADILCCAAAGIPKDMGWQGDKIRVLTNGFDPEDFSGAEKKPFKGLSLAYAGGFYVEWMNPDPLLRAIKELIASGEIDESLIEILYAGREGAVLKDHAEAFSLEGIVRDLGTLPRERALELEQQADLLLLLSYNMSGGRSDVLTGKFLEYMGAKKPIVASVSGDMPNSIVKRYIAEGELGFCCEEVEGERDFEALKSWLKAQYESVLKDGKPSFAPNTAFVEGFSHKKLAKRLAQMYSECGTR